MDERQLGTTHLAVTAMGIGLAALGRPGYINLGHADDLNGEYDITRMEQHAHSVLDAAYDGGIRYFDAARSYGKAEQFLASWLHSRNLQPDDVTVGSKWGYTYTADWQIEADTHEVKEHSLDVLRRQWGETQETLDGYLNLYQIHSATLSSGVLDNTDVLTELSRLKQTGVAIGLSLSGDQQAETLRKALTVTLDGKRLFDSIQATWNLLERSAGDALAEAHAAGMGVIIKEALANGRLTPRNANNPAFATQYAMMESQANRLNTTVDALALAAVLAQPWATLVLSGAATPQQLGANLGASSVLWDTEADEAMSSLIEPATEYWTTRSNLSWN